MSIQTEQPPLFCLLLFGLERVLFGLMLFVTHSILTARAGQMIARQIESRKEIEI